MLSTVVLCDRTFSKSAILMKGFKVTNMEENKNDHVALKVVSILLAIIGGIILFSVIFSFTALPIIKYNNANKNAEMGKYDVSVRILNNMTYKDSEQKFGEYALKAGEKYYDEGDYDNASLYFQCAINSENIEAAEKAKEYFEKDNSRQ